MGLVFQFGIIQWQQYQFLDQVFIILQEKLKPCGGSQA